MAACGDDVKPRVISPRSVECEACDEYEVDSFCHQCQQWFCKRCTKAHSRMKNSSDHKYTSLEQKTEQVKEQLKTEIRNLEAKTKELKSCAAQNSKTITEIEATQTQAKVTSEQLKTVVHEDVDRYFDVINKRIDSFCQNEIKAVNEQKRDKELENSRQLKTAMDKALTHDNSRSLTEAEELISKAQELIKSLDDIPDVAVAVPRVKLGRNTNWSLEGAVNLHLQRMGTRRNKVRTFLSKFRET